MRMLCGAIVVFAGAMICTAAAVGEAIMYAAEIQSGNRRSDHPVAGWLWGAFLILAGGVLLALEWNARHGRGPGPTRGGEEQGASGPPGPA
jgi:hypothetical protein